MASIIPFKGLRPQPQFASQVASPPYDVLSSEEAREMALGNPNSFLHVTKAEIDVQDVDSHSSEVYEKARENLLAFRQRGVLFLEEKPCYYIYSLTMGDHKQTGLVCCSSVADYEKDIIRKHELTRPDKEKDRIDHMKITGAQTGNVFLAYKNSADVDELIEQWKSDHEPVYDFVSPDGIRHQIWVVNNQNTIDSITNLFRKISHTYIADGHHRAASAAKVRSEVKTQSANYFLTTLFPSNQLKILDYNRVIRDLGMSEDQFLTKLRRTFSVAPMQKPVRPDKPHQFGLYLSRQWYILEAKKGTFDNDPIGVLDVTILSNNILSAILGIHDQRTDKRVDFVGGIRGIEELEERVDSGEMEAAFTLFPVSIDQLFAVADEGRIMPPKSTWFEPKLRDGLITHLIAE